MIDLLLLVLLLALSGLFSGAETALISLSPSRVDALVRDRRRGANALQQVKHDPSRMLVTILVGNNLVNIGASVLATVIATERFGSMGPGLAVGVLTVLILVFGEITPKSLATRYAERISLGIAPSLLVLMQALAPLAWLFARLTDWLHRCTGMEGDPAVTESEMISMLAHGEREGIIDATERDIIQRVFAFGELEVADVMTPRRDVFVLERDCIVEDVLGQIAAEPYSRIPLSGERPDEIVQVLYLRDVFEAISAGDLKVPLSAIARLALFVPGNQGLEALVSVLRRNKQHMAIVVDEQGLMQGVVTLEDVLEELVGEIYDESDILPEGLTDLGDGRIRINGPAEVRQVEKHFGLDLPGKPTDTVSGWILGRLGRIPAEGEAFVLDGFQVTVLAASRRRIREVSIAAAPAGDSGEAPAPTGSGAGQHKGCD